MDSILRGFFSTALLALILASMIPLAFYIKPANAALVEVIRTPPEVYSWQSALIFAKIPSRGLVNVKLEVSVTMNASINTIIVKLPLLPAAVKYILPMLPIPGAPGWYVAVIPGLPAGTTVFQYTPLIGPPINIKFTIDSRVNYRLLVDGSVVAEGSYRVLGEGVPRCLPPIVVAIPYELSWDPLLVEETLGLGPKGWVLGAGESFKALVIALDDRGLTSLTFEYKVGMGPWIQAPVSKDPLMQNLTDLVNTVNSLIHSIEDKVRILKPDFDIPDVSLPGFIGNAVVPAQEAGVYVMYRASATDVDGNTFSSPMGFYYVVNKASPTRILIVDPHVRLWVLQENFNHLIEIAKESSDYQMPEEIVRGSEALSKVSSIIEKYGVEPFHHWEKLGKQYNLYIAWPGEGLANLLKNQSEGGYEPHVVILSNLWLGYNETGETGWSWDLRDINVNGKTLLEHLVSYIKEKHAGLIATHGTLSDEVVWASCISRYKVGARGHVGYSLADVNVQEERTIAAMLGMPELAIWEYLRDSIASALCANPETEPIGMVVGSTPLQVPYTPWDGVLEATPEARQAGWLIPEEVVITIPSVYSEFGFKAYTQVGWQLGLPRVIAYTAWRKIYESEPLIKQLHSRLSMLVENFTSRVVSSELASNLVKRAVEHGFKDFHKSIISANIMGSTFRLTLYIPEIAKSVSMDVDLAHQSYESILQKLPVKIIALSPDATAGIIAYDKYWDPSGYRSVYFSFEIEAAESEIAWALLASAVEWTLRWEYRDGTELLGGLVRVPRELAGKFNEELAKLPGNLVLSKGLILNEEGFSRIEVNTAGASVLHILVAHPTTDELEVYVEGSATIASVASVYWRLTKVTINTQGAGKVAIGLRARSDMALNPAYIAVTQETPSRTEIKVGQPTTSPQEVKTPPTTSPEATTPPTTSPQKVPTTPAISPEVTPEATTLPATSPREVKTPPPPAGTPLPYIGIAAAVIIAIAALVVLLRRRHVRGT